MQNISFRSSVSFILIEKIWGGGGGGTLRVWGVEERKGGGGGGGGGGGTLRIFGLDERKGRWVVGQDFQGNFWVNVTCLPF